MAPLAPDARRQVRFVPLMMPNRRLLLITAGVLAALVAVAVFRDYFGGRGRVLVVTIDTLVLRDFPTGPDGSATPNPVLAVIPPGPRYPVLTVRDGRDFQAVRIRLAGDLTGWVITGPTAHVERSR